MAHTGSSETRNYGAWCALASRLSAGVTGQVFEAEGGKLSVANGLKTGQITQVVQHLAAEAQEAQFRRGGQVSSAHHLRGKLVGTLRFCPPHDDRAFLGSPGHPYG